MSELFTGSVVPSVSISNMVNKRAAIVAMLNQACDLLDRARELAEAAHIGFPRLAHVCNGRELSLFQKKCLRPLSPDDPDLVHNREENQAAITKAMVQDIDGAGWKYLMEESGLRSFMHAAARRQWDQQIYDGKFPELTKDNVASVFKDLYANRQDMFDQGVIAVFKHLSWCYKTNQPMGFGKRVVMSFCYSYGSISHEKADRLDDLMRVFHALDGKPEMDHRNGMYVQMTDSEKAAHGYPKKGANEYLSWKLFKNGNLHITFLRQDIIDAMNLILVRHYPAALAHDRHAA